MYTISQYISVVAPRNGPMPSKEDKFNIFGDL